MTTHKDPFAWMRGPIYEPEPLRPVPYLIRRRRARVRAAWIALAAVFILGGGALGFWGFPRLLISWMGGHG